MNHGWTNESGPLFFIFFFSLLDMPYRFFAFSGRLADVHSIVQPAPFSHKSVKFHKEISNFFFFRLAIETCQITKGMNMKSLKLLRITKLLRVLTSIPESREVEWGTISHGFVLRRDVGACLSSDRFII